VRKPHQPGAAINEKRRRKWIDRFGSYRAGIDNVAITSWLSQFAKSDRDVAARVLDAVEYYGQSHIYGAYRQALASLSDWDVKASRRKGKWAFCAMSRSAGESGDAMLHHFRVANKLGAAKYDRLFLTRSELFRLPNLPEKDTDRLGADDVVVLLDDFSGTGGQVCDAWNDPETSFGALLAGVGTVYLILVAASHKAMKRIKAETSIELVPAHQLKEADNVFSDECDHFSTTDRSRLLHYGGIADKTRPKGFGDSGFVVVFQHRTPNNSIPILHVENDEWIGLFPRH
jgi:hypothetical protein